jgi:hypothetical protein
MGSNDFTLEWSKLLFLTTNEVENSNIKDVEGVYRISKKETDGKFYVVYVGSTMDLETELKKIISGDDVAFTKQGGEFSFRYAPLKGDDVRKGVEKLMYKYYAPVNNVEEPVSTLIINTNLN